MNVLTITGNLTRDLELKKTTTGVSVVSGTIAVPRAFKGRNGEKETDFIDFVAWDKKADYLVEYAKKGDRLEISGRLESRQIVKDDQKKTIWECIVENVTSFSKRERQVEQEDKGSFDTPSVDIEDDDLPF